MITFDAWMLPDGESHLQSWMSTTQQVVDGRLTYQYTKYAAALGPCRRHRRAIDVGSHVGLWAYWMARDFAHVECFEPRPEHQTCWYANMATRTNALLHPVALGSAAREVGLRTAPTSSGDTTVDLGETGISMATLDGYHFDAVDLIKIDCEGYEAFVIEGGLETIRRCRPVVIVEQKPGHGQRFGRKETEAVDILVGIGARRVWEQSGDFVLAFPEA
jgi:FkbM family methyltransferase